MLEQTSTSSSRVPLPVSEHSSLVQPSAKVLSENCSFMRKHIYFLFASLSANPHGAVWLRQRFDRVETERGRLRAFAHLCVEIKVLCVKWGVCVRACVYGCVAVWQ